MKVILATYKTIASAMLKTSLLFYVSFTRACMYDKVYDAHLSAYMCEIRTQHTYSRLHAYVMVVVG